MLKDTFTAYLRGRFQQEDLVTPLEASGHHLEAALLDGRQPGHVGRALPAHAAPGDLWLDTVELMPMRAVENGWLALRPVERWQFGAFLDLAPWSGPRDVMDAGRLLAGDELGPVTHVLRDEASLYAKWFGKTIPHRIDWQLAGDTDALWGPVREWADAEYDGAYRVVDAALIDFDPDDDDPPALVLSATEAPPDVGFRTFAGQELFTQASPTETFGLRLGGVARR